MGTQLNSKGDANSLGISRTSLVPPLTPQKDHRNCMGGKSTQNRGCEVHKPTRHWDPCSSCFQQGLFQEWGQMFPKAELPLLPPPTVRPSPSLSLVMRRLTKTSVLLIIIIVVMVIYSTQSHISPVRLQMPMDLLILSHNAHTLAVYLMFHNRANNFENQHQQDHNNCQACKDGGSNLYTAVACP